MSLNFMVRVFRGEAGADIDSDPRNTDVNAFSETWYGWATVCFLLVCLMQWLPIYWGSLVMESRTESGRYFLDKYHQLLSQYETIEKKIAANPNKAIDKEDEEFKQWWLLIREDLEAVAGFVFRPKVQMFLDVFGVIFLFVAGLNYSGAKSSYFFVRGVVMALYFTVHCHATHTCYVDLSPLQIKQEESRQYWNPLATPVGKCSFEMYQQTHLFAFHSITGAMWNSGLNKMYWMVFVLFPLLL